MSDTPETDSCPAECIEGLCGIATTNQPQISTKLAL
jgi:hypothetical protein